jgi:eukaryotic-like serine/threonine-protein kinase
MPERTEVFPPGTPGRAEEPDRRLWRLWRQGERPDVGQFLAGQGELRPGQLAAVLAVDQRERWQRGERVPAEAYLRDHPGLGEDAESAVELVYGEYLLREELGEAPQLEEFRARFPAYADRLEQQVEFHRALGPPTGELSLGVTAQLAKGTGNLPARAIPSGTTWPVLPGYLVLGELGRGGMGVVYQARQAGTNRVVAVKMLLAGSLAGPADAARFRVEIEAAGRLLHPNIVHIYEVGEEAGRPYFSMEFAEGSHLAARLDGTPWPPRRAAELIETLADAVHHAHERGIVHRDLKPSNILLSAEGIAKVADFGLAKILGDGGAGQTQTGTILGTPSYMAPEQAAGQAVGPAADVYALGAILYELLTGRPPFKAETPGETIQQVLHDDPVPIRRLQPKVPRDLETVCLKCLEKEPARRYPSAQSLADDLRRFRDQEPIRARHVTRVERLWRWCRRNPLAAGLTGLAAALLVVIAVGASAGVVLLQRELRRAEDAERERSEQLAKAYLEQARARRLSGQPGQRFESLKALQAAAHIVRTLPLAEEKLHELRNEAIACLVLPDLEVARTWSGWPEASVHVDFADTLERYVRGDKHGNISVRRVADDAEIAHLPGTGTARAAFLSHAGEYLAAASSPTGPLWVWRLTGPRPELVYEDRCVHDRNPRFSADDRYLAYHQSRTAIGVLDLRTGRSKILSVPRGYLGPLAFHPDGRRLAFSWQQEDGGQIQVRDVVSEEVTARILVPGPLDDLAWHPGGKVLAGGGRDRRIYTWNAETGERTLALEGHTQDGLMLAFNHAGDRLMSIDWTGLLRLWDTRAGTLLLSIPAGWGGRLVFSPDDRLLAAGITTTHVRLFRVARGEELTRLSPALGGSQTWVAVSADGRLLVNVTEWGVAFSNRETGERLAFLADPGSRILGFEPSGALLTSGFYGLLRWPLRTDAASGERCFGPPQFLCQRALNVNGHAASADGNVVAFALNDEGALVLHRGRSEKLVPLGPQEDVRSCAVSPDGRWAATGSHSSLDGKGAKVWDAWRGELLKEFPVPGQCQVAFSPDGRWLVTSGGGCRLWEAGTWREGPVIGGGEPLFAPDGKLLAVSNDPDGIRLVETDGASDVARLLSPDHARLSSCCFTPDGTQLIVRNDRTQALHAFDLRAIGEQLARLELGGRLPASGPPATPVPGRPFRVRLNTGTLPLAAFTDPRLALVLYSLALALCPMNGEAYRQRGIAYSRLGEVQKAVADLSRALAWLPARDKRRGDSLLRRVLAYEQLSDLARAGADVQALTAQNLELPAELAPVAALVCNRLAWRSVEGPDRLADPKKAIPLARKAVALMPGEATYWNTLGVVCYRAGSYEEAIAALQQSLRAARGEAAAYDLFFLAMCHARRGDAQQARALHDRAVRLLEAARERLPTQWREELNVFRAESEALLESPGRR